MDIRSTYTFLHKHREVTHGGFMLINEPRYDTQMVLRRIVSDNLNLCLTGPFDGVGVNITAHGSHGQTYLTFNQAHGIALQVQADIAKSETAIAEMVGQLAVE